MMKKLSYNVHIMMGVTHAMPHFKTERLRLYVYKTAKCRLKQLTGFWFGL
jgi:hypothetical protein